MLGILKKPSDTSQLLKSFQKQRIHFAGRSKTSRVVFWAFFVGTKIKPSTSLWRRRRKTGVKCRLKTVFQQKYLFFLAFFIEYICFKQYFIYSYLESVLNSSTKIQFSSLIHAKELFIAVLKKDVRVIGNSEHPEQFLQLQNQLLFRPITY